VALELARRGADVVLMDRTGSPEGPTVLEIREMGRRCLHVRCDVTDSASVEQAARVVREEMGGVHILVNNAGVTRDQLLVRLSDADWDTVLATNLRGAFLCTRAFARDMMRARWGRIVNVSSVIATRGNVGQANYAASKSGLIGLTRSVARELASRGITANVVLPGYIETGMTEAVADRLRETILPQIPMARLGRPEDVAAVVGFLASEEAGYVTGQLIYVDGGLAMG
jgi:3-oxoacyl-[acyl-carrier protein] reductase